MSETIPTKPWMRASETLAVMAALESAGGQGLGVRLALAVPGQEAEEAEDAQGVLVNTRIGVAHEHDPARAGVGQPLAGRVEHLAHRVAVEGVQPEVPALGVLAPIGGESHHRAAPIRLDIPT